MEHMSLVSLNAKRPSMTALRIAAAVAVALCFRSALTEEL